MSSGGSAGVMVLDLYQRHCSEAIVAIGRSSRVGLEHVSNRPEIMRDPGTGCEVGGPLSWKDAFLLRCRHPPSRNPGSIPPRSEPGLGDRIVDAAGRPVDMGLDEVTAVVTPPRPGHRKWLERMRREQPSAAERSRDPPGRSRHRPSPSGSGPGFVPTNRRPSGWVSR